MLVTTQWPLKRVPPSPHLSGFVFYGCLESLTELSALCCVLRRELPTFMRLQLFLPLTSSSMITSQRRWAWWKSRLKTSASSLQTRTWYVFINLVARASQNTSQVLVHIDDADVFIHHDHHLCEVWQWISDLISHFVSFSEQCTYWWFGTVRGYDNYNHIGHQVRGSHIRDTAMWTTTLVSLAENIFCSAMWQKSRHVLSMC